jgi:hypothetical protein
MIAMLLLTIDDYRSWSIICFENPSKNEHLYINKAALFTTVIICVKPQQRRFEI